MSNPETAATLIKRIRDRRRSIKTFIRDLEPKGIRLTNFNIVCSAIATLLTAAPALFGKTLADVLGTAGFNSFTGRVLFAVAALFSLLATVSANVYRSHDMASRLAKAQGCDAKLEGLETLLELTQVSLKDGASQYAQHISEVSFICGSRSFDRSGSVDWVRGEIHEPERNALVDNAFSCSGWAEGLGPGLHLWLAVEIKGVIWPKEREVLVEDDATWKEVILEEGSVDSFSISLFVANNRANRRIRAWLDKGDQTGNYSELRRLRGMRRIAQVAGLRRKGSQDQICE
jgi:hypothetical protein